MSCVTSPRAGRTRVDFGAGQETETPRLGSVCSSEREWKRERNGRLARLIIIIKYKRSAREAKPDRGGRGAGILSLDLRNTSVDFSHCFLQTRQKPQDRRLVCDSKRLLFISTSFWIKTRSTACVLLARYLAIHRGISREQPWNPDSCAVSSVSEYEGCSLEETLYSIINTETSMGSFELVCKVLR